MGKDCQYRRNNKGGRVRFNRDHRSRCWKDGKIKQLEESGIRVVKVVNSLFQKGKISCCISIKHLAVLVTALRSKLILKQEKLKNL